MALHFAVEEQFDALSFIKYIKNTGRAYQRQAIELVNICRVFVEASSQEERGDTMLKV
jgi:hypothetical protein